MKDQFVTKKILNWYDLNKRSLPWRKNVSPTKKQYLTLVSEFMLQQTQVTTVIPYFNRFIKDISNLSSLAKTSDKKLFKLWEGLGYYSRVKNLKRTAQIIKKNFKGRLPDNFEDLISLPGIGNYTASAILAIAFNKSYIPLDGNVERVLKRYFFLKKDKEIAKENLHKKKLVLGLSPRSSDYAQALMELGALICKPINPICSKCPISKKCKSFLKKDFNFVKKNKKNIDKYFILDVYKKDKKYLLVKNTKFKFLKNLRIFPMQELSKPKKFDKTINFKMSNMNMNIKIQFPKNIKEISSSYWVDQKKIGNSMLPTFTKKVVKYLESSL
tara:strand:+ start:1016 stop:1999 length:984 start_codon:yes stop_codon:yes gene_type:complete